MARKKSTSGDQPGGEPSFELALAELEEIVAAMEEEQLPLEELVARYEKGSKLLARCESVLDEPAGPAAGTPDEYDDDDDIRLF